MLRMTLLGLLIACLAASTLAAELAPFDPSYVTPDASLVMLARPAELAGSKMCQPLVQAFDRKLKDSLLGFSVADVEEFKVILAGLPDFSTDDQCMYWIVRTRKPFDWKKYFDPDGKLRSEEINGRATLELEAGKPWYVWIPDERTVLYGMKLGIARATAEPDRNDRAEWADAWAAAARRPLAMLVRAELLTAMQLPGDAPPFLVDLAAEAKLLLASAQPTADGLVLKLSIDARSAETAERLPTSFAQACGFYSKAFIEGFQVDGFAESLLDLLTRLKVESDADGLTAETLALPAFLERLAQVIDPAPEEADEAAEEQGDPEATDPQN